MRPYPSRVALAGSTKSRFGFSNKLGGLGFHTVRGVIDPGNRQFHPRFVVVVDLWKNFCSGDDIVSSPAGGGSANARLGFSKKPVGLGIPHVVGGVDPGDHRFRPRFLLEL